MRFKLVESRIVPDKKKSTKKLDLDEALGLKRKSRLTETKYDLYINGDYVASTSKYKRAKDFKDKVTQDGYIDYLGKKALMSAGTKLDRRDISPNDKIRVSRAKNESLKNSEVDEFFTKAKKLGVTTLGDLKRLLTQEPETRFGSDIYKMRKYSKYANPEDKELKNESLKENLKNLNESKSNEITTKFDNVFKRKDNKETFNKIEDILGADELYGGVILEIKNIKLIQNVNVYEDGVRVEFNYVFDALVNGDFDRDNDHPEWIRFETSLFNGVAEHPYELSAWYDSDGYPDQDFSGFYYVGDDYYLVEAINELLSNNGYEFITDITDILEDNVEPPEIDDEYEDNELDEALGLKNPLKESASARAIINRLGKDDIEYICLKNAFNYDIKQARIDNKNKTYEIGMFKIIDGSMSTKNGKEFERVLRWLDSNGYKKVTNESLKEDFNQESIKTEIEKAIRDYFKHWDDEDYNDMVKDYLVIEVVPTNDGRTKVEVRAELTYGTLSKIADKLDPIVQKIDKDAYFDFEDDGIINAYLNTRIEEKLIQGKSEDTLKKNTETEIKSRKSPKQAYANAKSVQKNNMKEEFEEEADYYMSDDDFATEEEIGISDKDITDELTVNTAESLQDEEYVDIYDNTIREDEIVRDDIEEDENDLSDSHIQELAKKAIEENAKRKKPMQNSKVASQTKPMEEEIVVDKATEINQDEEEIVEDYVSPNAVDPSMKPQEVDLNNI